MPGTGPTPPGSSSGAERGESTGLPSENDNGSGKRPPGSDVMARDIIVMTEHLHVYSEKIHLEALKMKRQGGIAGVPQRGACDVWLDASALKKRKVQTLRPLRVLNRQSPYLPTRPALACTKQTTISTFFSALQAGERTSTTQRLPAAGSSRAPLSKDHELPPLEKQTQDLCFPQPASAPAQSDTRWEDMAMEKEAASEGEDLLHCMRVLQQKELLEHTGPAFSPLRERNIAQNSWQNKNQQPFPPAVVQAENQWGLLTWRDGCLMEAADLENVDPQLKGSRTAIRGFNEAAVGFRSRPSSEVCKSSSEDGPKESHDELSVPLFSQDSEGHKVISHHFARGPGKVPLQKKPLWNQGSPSAGFFDTGQQLHYDSLFTEDSEGNRVIKH